MKKNRALFVTPCYYTGTSFERIYNSIHQIIKQRNLPIDVYIDKIYPNTLKPGELDDVRYEKSQAETIKYLLSKKCSKYNKILFIDFFNPGVELVRYMSDHANNEIKIAALLHGGTFIQGDLYSDKWVSCAEKTWAEIYDRIYVPSQYAQSQIPSDIASKAVVKPWGMDNINQSNYAKPYENRTIDVVFPHRLNTDKGIDDFIKISHMMPKTNFVITTPTEINNTTTNNLASQKNITFITCKDTDDLYKILGSSKIVLSCAKQELFGYSIAEACRLGCVPILPSSQVYKELYDKNSLYEDLPQCIAMITDVLSKNLSINFNNDLKTSFEPLLSDFLQF